jgi:hypothetical protein
MLVDLLGKSNVVWKAIVEIDVLYMIVAWGGQRGS